MTAPTRGIRWSWRVGTLFGIDISIHATFLLLLAWVMGSAYRAQGRVEDAVAALALILAVFGSVILHELGHALTARRFGIVTRDITLLPIGGMARLERMPERPSQEMLVAVAGPLVSFALAAVLGFVGWALNLTPIGEVARINLMLGTFNLLPAFPMDGGRILRAGLAWRGDPRRATRIAVTVGQATAMVLGLLGLFGNPILVAIAGFIWLAAAAEANTVETNVLLSDLPATAAMLIDFRTLHPRDSLGLAAQLLLQGSQVDFPVVDDAGVVVGLLTRDRLVAGLAGGGPDSSVASAMRSPVGTVAGDTALGVVARQMQESESSAVTVVENGTIRGLVTLENLGELLILRKAVPGWSAPRR